MTFTTSLADRKDGGEREEGAIVPKKRWPGQACDLSVFLATADIWGGGRRRNPLTRSLPCPMNCSAVEKVSLTNIVGNHDHLKHTKIREERQLHGGELLVFSKLIIPPTPLRCMPYAEPAFFFLLPVICF